jgi:lactoylglutathione lyase
MYIEHVAFWVKDLEQSKQFYLEYFGGKAGPLYHNPKKQFTSYFISFESGARLELMSGPDKKSSPNRKDQLGITHLAFSVGSNEKVNILTERLRNDGYPIVSEPRTTGDGYYESVALDPEGNPIEITS